VKSFAFVRPRTPEALDAALAQQGPRVLKAGGVDLLDRMKERLDEPDRVVGLVDLEAGRAVEVGADGSLRLGALVTLAEIAGSAEVRRIAPSLADAAGRAASPPIRHRATLGGNLAQHSRCGYYRHISFPCLKRGADSCPVLAPGAVQEMSAIFDNSVCASAHASSLAPVLGSLDAVVLVRGGGAERRVEFADLWDAPRRGKASDLSLAEGEWIVAVEVPATAPSRLAYEEIRAKAAFDWALVSCAVRLLGGESAVKEARVWLGSVAPTPRRSRAAEAILLGRAFSEAQAARAGDVAAAEATPLPGNAYKATLVKVAVRRALTAAWERKG
jgi:xanthine dehydrogenase YagS FAD-binding subunit